VDEDVSTYQRFHELVLLAVGSVEEPLAVARGTVQGAGRGGLLLEHHGRREGRDDDVFLMNERDVLHEEAHMVSTYFTHNVHVGTVRKVQRWTAA